MTTTNKTANNLEEGVDQRLHDAADRLSEMKDDVAKNLHERVDSLGTLMKAHPLAAIGIGVGIGYLLARLVHR